MGVDVSTDEDAGILKIGNHRAPFAVKVGKIWPYLNIPGACWFPVNSDEQGGGVIEGIYTDYIVNDLSVWLQLQIQSVQITHYTYQ